MKFAAPLENLNKCVQAVQKVVPISSTMPILTGILLDVKDNVLTLTGNNIDVGIRCSLSVEATAEGSTVLPGRLFADIVRKLRGDTIKIEKDNSLDQMKIECGTAVYHMNYMAPEDFPTLPVHEYDFSFTIPVHIFKTLVEQVAFAAGDDVSRRFLTSVCFDFEGDKLTCVATNTFRLAMKEIGLNIANDVKSQILIPAKTLSDVSRIITDYQDEITVYVGKRKVFFQVGDLFIVSRLIDEDYLEYGRLIPSKFQTLFVVNRTALLEAAERADLMAGKTNTIKVSIGENICTLCANEPSVGQINEEILISRIGDDMEIALNVNYLMDVLKVLESKDIEIGLVDNRRPIVVREKDDDTYLYLLMPIKIKDE